VICQLTFGYAAKPMLIYQVQHLPLPVQSLIPQKFLAILQFFQNILALLKKSMLFIAIYLSSTLELL
jgi:hypothetical protein